MDERPPHYRCPGCGAFVPFDLPCGSAECRPRHSHAPYETPPANGPYTGRLPVRMIPMGVSLADHDRKSEYFIRSATRGARVGARRKKALAAEAKQPRQETRRLLLRAVLVGVE